MKTKLPPGTEAPIEQWLAEMKEPYASAAIGQIDKNWISYQDTADGITTAIFRAFEWRKSKEGQEFWHTVQNHHSFPKHFVLPPYPPEHLPSEPKQAECTLLPEYNSEPALPDFYVGMEIVAKVALNEITEGKTYVIAQLVPNNFFMIINNVGTAHYVEYKAFHKYFTLKNQPMKTIDPNELKPAKEWLNFLPEPIRTEALEACKKWPNWPEQICNFIDCLNRAINWGAPHGTNWNSIDEKLRRGEILPVQPEEVKEEKPTGPELVTYEEAINRLRAEVEATQKQNGKLQGEINFIKESMTQLLSKINPLLEQLKQERQATPTPEPDPIKLPLTIEEVKEFRVSIQDGKRDFFHTTMKYTFLHEKTRTKTQAYLDLSLIAEAQNEIVPLGEFVWVVNYTNGEFRVDNWTIDVVDIEIYFHSEQGLKDCIAANEQLFKDYLEI